jgi:hypothetical protein
MIWNLNCRKTRRLLALAAGNDVEERDLAGTHRHLAVCPHCREVWQGLKLSQQALEQTRAAPVAIDGDPGSAWPSRSIWPAVARHVRSIDEQAAVSNWQGPNWRGWLPAGALAAACLAVVMMSLPDAPPPGNSAQYRNPLVVLPQHAFSESQAGGRRTFPLAPLPDPDDEENQDSLPRAEQFRSF